MATEIFQFQAKTSSVRLMFPDYLYVSYECDIKNYQSWNHAATIDGIFILSCLWYDLALSSSLSYK